jgi:RNA polymerase sigma factor (TIGR02999 family)
MLIPRGTEQAERIRQMSTGVEITELLNAANSGDASAQDAAYQLVYDELKRCARRQSSLTPGSSLSPTALVSELYLKLSEKRVARIDNRRHFFALASRAMRQIMVDNARHRTRLKRGRGVVHTTVDTADLGATTAEQALELDAALTDLGRRDADLVRVVEWHFFGGMTFQEIGDELGRHERTVRHDWELARACLRAAMDRKTGS